MTKAIRRVVCIGSGLIGSGWAAHFLRCGLDVVAFDRDPTRGAYLEAQVKAAWPSLERLGLRDGASLDRLQFASNLDAALEGADFVQESAFEDEELKIDLLSEIDRRLPADRVIASSSSGFLAERLRSQCRHGDRVIVGHPFNPPYLIPLVEIAGVTPTNASVVEAAKAFYEWSGMKVVTLQREIRGYIANRIQSAVLREVLYMVEQGIASVADIDAAMSFGPARRWAFMGPSAVYYLGGGSPEGYRAFIDLLVSEIHQDYAAPASFVPDRGLTERYVAEVTAWMSGTSYGALRAKRDEGLVSIEKAIG